MLIFFIELTDSYRLMQALLNSLKAKKREVALPVMIRHVSDAERDLVGRQPRSQDLFPGLGQAREKVLGTRLVGRPKPITFMINFAPKCNAESCSDIPGWMIPEALGYSFSRKIYVPFDFLPVISRNFGRIERPDRLQLHSDEESIGKAPNGQ